ncbi:glycoside hydrolase family 88/105 protein [Puniceicoccus vermicola]|uniref:Glycoside hydrolase family 88 protein n=1 Tax=Puniceicoccus vermicola TaxID=388746 RepID=A0A7X1B0H2_9BACT|nr:glycoside hydrolase family 88 protein [Puniceicoccus vermicola]MBC2603361.1 glycoside hydrolase family 88 protein [Puniceicoccus vermicola]
MKQTSPFLLAQAAFRKHKAVQGSYDVYPGIVSMHGMARLATETQDENLLEEIRSEIMPYVRGERSFPANFPNYLCGGNGAAWLLWRGKLPEVEEAARQYAEQIMNEAPRDNAGILCHPNNPEEQKIWIDVAFAVSPFLLFTGLALGNDDYLEEAFQQTAKMVKAFHREDTGLVIQAHNFSGAGHKTEDHWSRGNGWAALALADVAIYLPDDHPRKAEAISLFQDHVRACAKFQDEEGLWHQEMTDLRLAYVETSGSGLMLYALGAGIQAGLIPDSEMERFQRGLKGLNAYITEDTDIFHTCCGCLSPGQGTKLEYRAHPAKVNDHHAFGPVVLAMGQAHLLGIQSI